MKGIEDFYKIAGVLNENYAVALVGLTKKQIRSMPNYIKVDKWRGKEIYLHL